MTLSEIADFIRENEIEVSRLHLRFRRSSAGSGRASRSLMRQRSRLVAGLRDRKSRGVCRHVPVLDPQEWVAHCCWAASALPASVRA